MRTGRRSRAGLSLAEVVVSAMLVGVVMVGALKCVGAVVRGRYGTGGSFTAGQMARQLLSEILAAEYAEPDDLALFGVESPESAGTRSDWDDVDDYHLWVSTPPQDRSGVALPNSTGWQREVLVEWVDPNDPATTVGAEQGAKRITVTVRRNGEIQAVSVGLRTDS